MIKLKEIINKIFDYSIIKQENKELKRLLEEEKNKNKPLIDLKNKYLSELRCKNLEIVKLKKQINK